jgi:YD repeat-containing protein
MPSNKVRLLFPTWRRSWDKNQRLTELLHRIDEHNQQIWFKIDALGRLVKTRVAHARAIVDVYGWVKALHLIAAVS